MPDEKNEKLKLRIQRLPTFYVLESNEPAQQTLENLVKECNGAIIRTHNASGICGANGIIADITGGGTGHGSIIENGIAADLPTCILYSDKSVRDGEYFLARQEGPPEIKRLMVYRYDSEKQRTELTKKFLEIQIEQAQRNGAYIVIDGPDGGGKTTQARVIKEWLENKKYEVVHTREPGGTPIGEQIRKILLDPENKAMSLRTEIKLYQAVRGQLVQEVVSPALARGAIVLAERNYFASLAYQGHGADIDLQTIRNEAMFVMSRIRPDIACILLVPPLVGMSRTRHKNLDRIEQRKLDFHRKVYEGFIHVSRTEPCARDIDAMQTPEAVTAQLKEIIQKNILDKAIPLLASEEEKSTV